MATTKQASGFTDDEKAAMRAHVDELRASGRGGAKKADEAQACLDAIEAMPEADRTIGERIHAVVGEVAPSLRPKTWYGMPAYVNEDNKVVCFFKPAAKFGARYATFGFTDAAVLDDGSMWATEFALTSADAAVITAIGELVEKAVD